MKSWNDLNRGYTRDRFARRGAIIAALIGALCVVHTARADPGPRPAPRLYVTHNHGVAITVPSGLSYCPLPVGWVGADHGRALLLAPSASCDADPRPPFIGVFYGYNVAEFTRRDGTEGPPRTPAELLERTCPNPAAQPGLFLLGRPALICRSTTGFVVTLTTGTPYALEPTASGPDAPDHELLVTLSTVSARLPGDFRKLERLLAHLSICTPEWARRTPGRPVCLRRAVWW